MSVKHNFPPSASRADVFMYIMRVFLLNVVKGFALGKNNYDQWVDAAFQALSEHGIAPIHLARVANAYVALLNVINAEYDEIEKKGECPN